MMKRSLALFALLWMTVGGSLAEAAPLFSQTEAGFTGIATSPFDIQYSSVLFDRLSVNSSGNLLFGATEKAPGASTAALAGLGAGNVNSGTHSYKVTFVTAGGETDAGAVSATVTTTAGDGQVALSAIPTGTTFTTSRKVYRTAAGNATIGPWLLLATIADNTATTYADNIADASLTTTIPTTNTAIDTRMSLLNTGVLDLGGISPSMTFTDTTASAKSLTIAVDANLAQLRESAGAAGSLLVLDLVNKTVGVGVTPGTATSFQTAGKMLITGGVENSADGTPAGIHLSFDGTNGHIFASQIGVATKSLQIGYSGGSNYLFLYGSSALNGFNTTSPASLLDLRAGDLTMSGANGQKWVLGRKTELTTIAAAATTTTTITIPANAILEAVLMRVTTVIPTAATMVVTATTTGTILQQGASIAVAAGTTDIGTRAWGTNYQGVAAQTITITPNATPIDNTGRVRFDIYYREPTVATS